MKSIVIHTSKEAALPLPFLPHRALHPAAPVQPPALAKDKRPTILHFTYSIGGGGAEAMLVNLVESLDPSQFRTVVVAVNASPWPHAAKRIRDAGASLHDLEGEAYLSRSTLARLRMVLHAERPDVMQTWMHHADLVGGWVARIAGVKKVLWSIHCREIHRNPGESAVKSAFFRRALGLSSKFIPSRILSCSAAAIEDHVKKGYPRKKMLWIPNGIDASRFRPSEQARVATRAELGIPEGAPLIGYVGRFHEMKDLPTFFRAAALLQQKLPDAHFVLCGGLEVELSETEREAFATIPNRTQVRFVPFRADPWNLYPAFDIFSLSSRTEACPMTVMEAMACGVPCITTEAGDCSRLLDEVGHTVPLHDAEGLAKAWQVTTTLDASTLHELAEASRQRVIERFTIAGATQRYAETYAQLLNIKK